MASQPPRPRWRRPPPTPSRRMTYPKGTKQRQVQFAASDGAMLAGTLLLPMISEIQYVPGVVLVAGSGPTDRDGNNSLVPVRIDLLKQIAELLAGVGIASLRYDKRGIGASGRPSDSAESAGACSSPGRTSSATCRPPTPSCCATTRSSPTPPPCSATAKAPCCRSPPPQAMGKRAPYALVLASAPGRPLRDDRARPDRTQWTVAAGRSRPRHGGDHGDRPRAGRRAARAAPDLPGLCRTVLQVGADRSIRPRSLPASTRRA